MANITVHVLNFHHVASHIHLILENNSTTPHTFYRINRWNEPGKFWEAESSKFGNILKSDIDKASSSLSFCIEQTPEEITEKWQKYWDSTKAEEHVLGKNCAVAVQWFLTEVAKFPEPSLKNISLNHLAFGIIWPSFIPCPVTLPGRIMSNAHYHLDQDNNPEALKDANEYSRLFVLTSVALGALVVLYDMIPLAVTLAAAIIAIALSPLIAVGYYTKKALSSDSDSEEHQFKLG